MDNASLVNIREAKNQDIKEIVNLIFICFQDKFNVIFGSKFKEGKNALIEDFKSKPSLEGIFVASSDKKIVGVFSLQIKENKSDWISTFRNIIKFVGPIRGLKAILVGSFFPTQVKKDSCYMEYVAVLPGYHKRGIAEKLIKQGEKYITNKNKKYIFGVVNSSNIPS